MVDRDRQNTYLQFWNTQSNDGVFIYMATCSLTLIHHPQSKNLILTQHKYIQLKNKSLWNIRFERMGKYCKMIYKERLKILFTIITLVVRAEADFLDELNVALENLQDTVDKMRLENAETNKKVETLQSEMTIMKEANSKSFEKIEQLIQNIEGKVDAASDVTVLVRTKIDDVDNRLEDLDNKLSKLEINLVEGNNAVIKKVSKIDLEKLREGQSTSFENVNRLQNELKTLNLNMNSKLEEVCNDNLVAINSSVTALAEGIDNFGDCGFFYNGQQENHMMFKEPGTEFHLTTKSSLSTCQLRILAVGGGGRGGYEGGGSGYIQYVTQTLSSSPTFIKLIVGDKRGESKVTIAGNTIRALPGKGHSEYGGDGFSGGGGGPNEPCNGGTNGGNGECSDRGKGTGEDISQYHFKNFQLRAGLGGIYQTESSGEYRGGGGGGIIINGDGPGVRANKDGYKGSAGEGFGGGGFTNSGSEHPGVVLIEIVAI